jgi:hypothetical protein
MVAVALTAEVVLHHNVRVAIIPHERRYTHLGPCQEDSALDGAAMQHSASSGSLGRGVTHIVV